MRASKLILIGLAAAIVSAGIAFALEALRAGQGPRAGTGLSATTCITAARDLDAGHKLVADDLVSVEMAPPTSAEGVLRAPSLVIGRTVAGPLAKGQAIRESDLVPPGSGASIASQLSSGMRAMTVTLRDSGPEVVLYPGALVDMLATIERPSKTPGQRESVTVTLLERIRVLAVNDEAVGIRPAPEPAGDRRLASRKLTVTLAVTPEQAVKVELASSRGTIGIMLRSGSDDASMQPDRPSATTSSLLGLKDDPEESQGSSPDRKRGEESPKAVANQDASIPPPQQARPPVWEVSVTRGGLTVNHSVPDRPTAQPNSANRTP